MGELLVASCLFLLWFLTKEASSSGACSLFFWLKSGSSPHVSDSFVPICNKLEEARSTVESKDHCS